MSVSLCLKTLISLVFNGTNYFLCALALFEKIVLELTIEILPRKLGVINKDIFCPFVRIATRKLLHLEKNQNHFWNKSYISSYDSLNIGTLRSSENAFFFNFSDQKMIKIVKLTWFFHVTSCWEWFSIATICFFYKIWDTSGEYGSFIHF